MAWFRSSDGPDDEFAETILNPLPAQSRATPSGRAMLTLADFAGRALSATGFGLLMVAGGANLGGTLLAVLLNRAAPGRAVLAFIVVGLSWVFWAMLALLRWRLNAAGPGLAATVTVEPVATQSPAAFSQRATAPEELGEDDNPDSYTSSPTVGATPATRQGGERGVSIDGAERSIRAADEFAMRRNTLMPRVEAAQRAIRTLVGGPEQPAWVRFDLRPLVVAFVGVLVSFPVVLITSAITLIALVVATAPF